MYAIIIATSFASYLPPNLYEIMEPSLSADFMKCSGRTFIPPRRTAMRTDRTDADGGYRFPASFVPFRFTHKKTNMIADAATVAMITGSSPLWNI